jgi:O-acetyl-ADP-ribose deacetylase (regulator of RNase III)
MGIGVGHLDAEEAARAQVEVLIDHLDSGQAPSELTLVVRGEYEADVYDRVVSALTKERFPMRN